MKSGVIKLKCKECNKVIKLKATLRNKKRLFCSQFCAKRNNGKRNKGKKRSEKTKRKISEALMGEKNPFYGKRHTKETKRKISLANKGRLLGKKHPNWKGGLKHRPDGYIRNSKTDKYIHREIMEKYLGRKLKKWEVVHHKNENPSDNRIKNLELTTNSKHRKEHMKFQKRDKKGRLVKK